MTFITGMFIIDAPASALNNSGEPIPGARADNTSSVKFIRGKDGLYPYVSAQAVRYWLRNTLESSPSIEWHSSPIYREEKIVYTDANPIEFWDDDLLGYMRAMSKSKKKDRGADPEYEKMTPVEEDNKENPKTLTRVSPFRVSTIVSLAPVNITNDFGTMSRHEGDAVPHEHQFYKTTLQGLFSLNLALIGKFYYRRRTGFQNLDNIRLEIAENRGLKHLEDEKAYEFDSQEKTKRIRALLAGMAHLDGGAKQALHYTPVSPVVAIMAVTSSGNHPFNYLFTTDQDGRPHFQETAFFDAVDDAKSQLLSPVFVGWKPGYLPEEQKIALDGQLQVEGVQYEYGSPRAMFEELGSWIENNQSDWTT